MLALELLVSLKVAHGWVVVPIFLGIASTPLREKTSFRGPIVRPSVRPESLAFLAQVTLTDDLESDRTLHSPPPVRPSQTSW